MLVWSAVFRGVPTSNMAIIVELYFAGPGAAPTQLPRSTAEGSKRKRTGTGTESVEKALYRD